MCVVRLLTKIHACLPAPKSYKLSTHAAKNYKNLPKRQQLSSILLPGQRSSQPNCWRCKGSKVELVTLGRAFWNRLKITVESSAKRKQIRFTLYIRFKDFFIDLPSSRIASCVGTAGTVMWHLHLMRPCCVALGKVLIWVVSPDWFKELCLLGFLIPK